MADVVSIFVALALSLLHHNNVGITYPRTFNLKMELVRSIPLYSMAMFQSMVTLPEVPFVITPTHIIVSMRSRP